MCEKICDVICDISSTDELSSPHLDLHSAGDWCLNQPLLALIIYWRCSWGDHLECPYNHWIETGSCRVQSITAISEVCGGVRWTTFSSDTKKLLVSRLEYLLGHILVGLFHTSPDLLHFTQPALMRPRNKPVSIYIQPLPFPAITRWREKEEYPTDGVMVPLLLKHCYWEVWPWVREQERGQEPWHFRWGNFLYLKKWNFSQ